MPSIPKVLNGRAATAADAEDNKIVFYIPDSRSIPYSFGQDLPLRARLVDPERSGIAAPGDEIVVVQAERGDTGDVLIGFLYGDEQEGVCQLDEIEILGPVDPA